MECVHKQRGCAPIHLQRLGSRMAQHSSGPMMVRAQGDSTRVQGRLLCLRLSQWGANCPESLHHFHLNQMPFGDPDNSCTHVG